MQPSLTERYAIAARLALAERATGLLDGPVLPHWSRDSRHFWYAARTASGIQHRLVDVDAAQQRDLFDAPALAAALTLASGKTTEPAALPLARLGVDAGSDVAEFAAHAARWRWQGDTQQLQRLGDDFGDRAAISPDGVCAVTLDGANLVLHDARQTQARILTEDGEAGWGYGDYTDCISPISARLQGLPRPPSVLWSPDSRWLAVLRTDLRRVPLQHLVQAVPDAGVRPRLHSWPYAMPGDGERARHELWFISREGRRVRGELVGLESHFMTPFALGLARWSADSRHLDLLDPSRDGKSLKLWRVAAGDGSALPLLSESGPGVVRASPSLAEPPNFQVLADGRLIWWSQRDGWGHLYLVDPDGSARPITQGPWQVRRLLHVDERVGRILFSAGGREAGCDPYFNVVYSVGIDGGNLTLLTPEHAQHEVVATTPDGSGSVAPNGSCFVDNFSTVSSPGGSLLRDRSGALRLALAIAQAPDPVSSSLPSPEPFSIAAHDPEAELWGLLYKPLGFDATQRYPVVEVIYGAPQTAVVPKSWAATDHGLVAEQLAALGFVAVILDGPGTPYRSQAFQLASHGHIENTEGLRDHAQALRTLAATRPWMDTERVGVIGGSGGGYATVRAMGTFPEFYKAGVSMCGNHDQAAYVAGWGETYQGLYDAARYAEQASTAVAANISGALLLIHGEMDDNVHPAMTLRVVDALIRADRNFDLLIVPNAGHMLVRLRYVRRRSWDHLVRHLMQQEPPLPARLTDGG